MDHDVLSGLLKLDVYRSSQPSAGVAPMLEFGFIASIYSLHAALAAVRASVNAFIDADIDEEAITSARCRLQYSILVCDSYVTLFAAAFTRQSSSAALSQVLVPALSTTLCAVQAVIMKLGNSLRFR